VQDHEWLLSSPVNIIFTLVDLNAPCLYGVVAMTAQPLWTHMVTHTATDLGLSTVIQVLHRFINVDVLILYHKQGFLWD
jgi:hypothetical protein